MNTKITLPTPPAIRERLEKAGWADVMGDGSWWHHDQRRLDLNLSEPAYLRGHIPSDSFSVPLDAAVEVAAILGIAPLCSLTNAERKAVAWAMELMGDCDGRDTLRALVSRFTGEAAPGYRLVPEDVAEKALPYIKALIAKSRQIGWTLNDCDAEVEKMKRLEAWANLASALSRKDDAK